MTTTKTKRAPKRVRYNQFIHEQMLVELTEDAEICRITKLKADQEYHIEYAGFANIYLTPRDKTTTKVAYSITYWTDDFDDVDCELFVGNGLVISPKYLYIVSGYTEGAGEESTTQKITPFIQDQLTINYLNWSNVDLTYRPSTPPGVMTHRNVTFDVLLTPQSKTFTKILFDCRASLRGPSSFQFGPYAHVVARSSKRAPAKNQFLS